MILSVSRGLTVLLCLPALVAALAACGQPSLAPATTPVAAAATGEAPAAPSQAVGPADSGPVAPTPGGAEVAGIEPCSLLTQAEAEAALGAPLKAPVDSSVAGVSVVTCMYQSLDGEGPQVGVTVQGAPDPFRPDLVAAAAGPPYSGERTAIGDLGDEAWWWVDPRGFRVEARDGDRFASFEFNDFRAQDAPAAVTLDALVPLMRIVLSRLP